MPSRNWKKCLLQVHLGEIAAEKKEYLIGAQGQGVPCHTLLGEQRLAQIFSWEVTLTSVESGVRVAPAREVAVAVERRPGGRANGAEMSISNQLLSKSGKCSNHCNCCHLNLILILILIVLAGLGGRAALIHMRVDEGALGGRTAPTIGRGKHHSCCLPRHPSRI